MSAHAHPTQSAAFPGDRVVDQLMAVARNASLNIEEHDPIDYWYRLGQRNAYAHATAQLLAPELGHDPFTIAERITTALDAGTTDLRELRDAAYGARAVTTPPEPSIEWVGPKAFDAQHRNIRGVDRDYGMRWGPRSNQRISLRLDGDAATNGLLYAYDPTWQEYAVLSTSAPRAAVDRAFAHATDTDIHMPIETFVQLVGSYRAALECARRDPASVAEVQL
ncbi:hypothetical protein GCM10009868_40870 [Terrabacter aerolatus]|uniref:Uncharacterized protein n=1 Tax=Terrabacter aerolatus TaxID=422442 RepID=A0A512D602_9MICO|nr:hypothetical protein [Terrabacter aerolatus]GEO31901.1 hypothetical protein TAE01_37110 [Terrabacter aerolatus]